MVLPAVPVVVAGARVAAGTARGTAKAASGIARASSRRVSKPNPSVQRAQVNRANPLERSGRRADERRQVVQGARDVQRAMRQQPQTTDEQFTEEQYAKNSVSESARIRRERKAVRDEEGKKVSNPINATRSHRRRMSIRGRAKARQRLLKGEEINISKQIRLNALRMLLTASVWAYMAFFFGWLLQILGFGLAVGLADTFDWVPLLSDTIADGAIVIGMGIFAAGYVLALLILFCINGAVITLKRLSIDQAILWLSMTMLPVVHVATLGIWLARRKV